MHSHTLLCHLGSLPSFDILTFCLCSHALVADWFRLVAFNLVGLEKTLICMKCINPKEYLNLTHIPSFAYNASTGKIISNTLEVWVGVQSQQASLLCWTRRTGLKMSGVRVREVGQSEDAGVNICVLNASHCEHDVHRDFAICGDSSEPRPGVRWSLSR